MDIMKDKSKIKTDGNGYCDTLCPYFEPSKKNYRKAFCKYAEQEIDFYDWFLTVCGVD